MSIVAPEIGGGWEPSLVAKRLERESETGARGDLGSALGLTVALKESVRLPTSSEIDWAAANAANASVQRRAALPAAIPAEPFPCASPSR